MDIFMTLWPIWVLLLVGVPGWIIYSEHKEEKQRRYREYLDSRVKPYKPRD